MPDAHLVDATADEQLANEAYSEGVRQLVWKYHRTRPSYKIVARSPTYVADWAAARFCLAPMGVGWGVRLLWAIAGGCVPVIASSEVSSWFDDVLDYRSFALHGVPKMSMRQLPALLEALPPERLRAMQTALWKHRSLFLWEQGGLAYNMTMYQLCQRSRRGRHRAGDCNILLPPSAAELVHHRIVPQRR